MVKKNCGAKTSSCGSRICVITKCYKGTALYIGLHFNKHYSTIEKTLRSVNLDQNHQIAPDILEGAV